MTRFTEPCPALFQPTSKSPQKKPLNASNLLWLAPSQINHATGRKGLEQFETLVSGFLADCLHKIFCDSGLIAVICADGSFVSEDHNRKKSQEYLYEVIAEDGIEAIGFESCE